MWDVRQLPRAGVGGKRLPVTSPIARRCQMMIRFGLLLRDWLFEKSISVDSSQRDVQRHQHEISRIQQQ
jgi:hypothetical protein